ncbi:MAG: hypothetical protein R2728_16335 [Chitinophagales bacterium]
MRIIYVSIITRSTHCLKGVKKPKFKNKQHRCVLSFDVGYTRSDYNFGFDDIIIDYVTNENAASY